MPNTPVELRQARFWDRLAKRYAKKPVADEATYQRKLQITRDHLSPAMEILEFGCGTGSTAITHAPHVRHLRAIDISSKMLEIAQGKAALPSSTSRSRAEARACFMC
jgi:ubiquinone/menaquinone biosynthesis C-methylase UbiE